MKLELQHGSRTKLLAGIVMILMAIFIGRLFYLQIIKHDSYVAEARQEQVKRLTIPAKRGLIYAMDGDTPVQLVMNETVYTLFADPEIIVNTDKALDTIRAVAGGNMQPRADELIKMRGTRYQILAKKLTRTQAEMIKKEKIIGLGFQEESQRVYPEGSLAAQTLGFVNGESNGQYGVESKLNQRLTGTDGMLQSVTDVSRVPLTIGNNNINRPAKNGENIVLTIDRNVQSYAEKALADGIKKAGAQKGSVIVMDPQTGRVMAMANLPTYNPAEFSKVTDAAAFNNAVATIPYEAGSVIKTMTVATGIDKGVIQPDSTFYNTDSVKVGDKTIKNATKGQTGTITMQRALDYSLNTGMVTVAQRLGGGSIDKQARDTMYDYFHHRFGLGSLTGIEVAGEAAGDILSPDSPAGNAVQYATMSFGQGMNVTMVQVASGFSALINGGTYYQPTVIGGTMSDDATTFKETQPTIARKNVISPQTSDKVHSMVREARAKFYSHIDKKGYDIGGKTGTSQTLINGQYVDEQTVGTYLGYGGDDSPKYVIMVQVSGKNLNLEGGKHAMPIFTDISNWIIDYMKLQPKE
ncbi:MAG: penicillin-binding protein 2 [Candidatus Saccharimonadales bacterium]